VNEGQRGYQPQAVRIAIDEHIPLIVSLEMNLDSGTTFRVTFEVASEQRHMKRPFWLACEVHSILVQQNTSLPDSTDGRAIFEHDESSPRKPPFAFDPDQLLIRLVINNKIGQTTKSQPKKATMIETRRLDQPDNLASRIVNLAVALVTA
jgi:hypothetical protein